MSESSITRDWEGDRLVFRVNGVFDRPLAWALRDRVERETAQEVLLDFSLVREFSDLGIAVLAHGLAGLRRRVAFRGLRQHQLRIFRYCGVPVDASARDAIASPAVAAPLDNRASTGHRDG
jgi:anti-anti-sigma regulatory factor